jgi:hypothetical protein
MPDPFPALASEIRSRRGAARSGHGEALPPSGSETPVARCAGMDASGVMAQGEQLRVSPHRVIRMVVVERIAVPPPGPGVGGGCCVLVAARWAFGVVHGRPIS